MKKNQTLMNVNLILSCATAVMYTTYLALKREVRLLIIMVGAYSVLYLLTNNHINSLVSTLVIVLSLDLLLDRREGWEGWEVFRSQPSGPFAFPSNTKVQYGSTIESFKGKSKKKKKMQVTSDDDDDVQEDYIDLGTSFMEAYKNLTPGQLNRMNNDTKELFKQQKNLIETLNNMGPLLKGGKQIMEKFQHYFKDEI